MKGRTCNLNQYDSIKNIAFIRVIYVEPMKSMRVARGLRLDSRLCTALACSIVITLSVTRHNCSARTETHSHNVHVR